jgi:hypothetical protein
MAGTRVSESSSLDWIAEGRGADDKTPMNVWTVAGLNVIPSSYIFWSALGPQGPASLP